MKVAHLSHTQESGGAELALCRVLNSLDGMWEATLFLPKVSSNSDPVSRGAFSEIPQSVETVTIGPSQAAGGSTGSVLGKIWLLIAALIMAVQLRMNNQFVCADIVYTNSTRSAFYGRLALLGLQTRLVVHLRDLCNAEALGGLGFLILSRFVLPRADAVIANSAFTLASAETFLRNDCEKRVIPSPIGINRVTEPPRLQEYVSRVGMVARLDNWKGQDLLLYAFKEAFERGDARLFFAGSAAFGREDWADQLRDLAVSLGLDDRVVFLGHIEDISLFIDSMDICVQASTRPEPLGQNVLQYLARARPVVVSNEGGPCEWIVDDGNGLLFDARCTESLAGCLERLKDMELRSKLSLGAYSSDAIPTDNEVVKRLALLFLNVLSLD